MGSYYGTATCHILCHLSFPFTITFSFVQSLFIFFSYLFHIFLAASPFQRSAPLSPASLLPSSPNGHKKLDPNSPGLRLCCGLPLVDPVQEYVVPLTGATCQLFIRS